MKFRPSSRSSGKVSRVRVLPFVSSSPMESRPTRGLGTCSTSLAYMWPITANWRRLFGSQSTFAPTSSSTQGVPAEVGRTVASAGRSTPWSEPRTILAVAIAAPVLPAVTNPPARPLANHLQADAHGAVALGADGERRLVLHADPLAGLDEEDGRALALAAALGSVRASSVLPMPRADCRSGHRAL